MRKFLGFSAISFLLQFATAIVGLFASQASVSAQIPSATSSNTAVTFLAEVALKYPGAVLLKSVTLNATAKWTVGSQKDSGTATLEAQADGSNSLQLNLDKASRTESRTALGDSRACQWTDSQGSHQLNDVDCNASVAWFAPVLAIKPVPAVSQLLAIVDDGQVTRDAGTLRQISYRTPLLAKSTKTADLLTNGTRVSVLYDPQTLLPSSLEYIQHADTDLNTTFPVRIVYSNYQAVAGVPVPYQIDRYVNNVLQLSLTITSASLK